MDNKDWFDCGARIGDLVQSAIDSSNYQHLNQAITDVINDTAKALQKSLNGENRGKERGKSPYTDSRFGEYRAAGNAYDRAKERVNTGDLFDAISREMRGGSRQGRKQVRKSLRGFGSLITGISLTVVFGVGALVCGLLAVLGIGGGGLFFTTLLLTIFALISGILGRRGYGTRMKMRRADRYLQVLGDRDYCTVEELAAGTGKSAAYVRKDLREMISEGVFDTAAYLDEGETTFMVSHSAYQQYQDALKMSRQRQAEEEKQAQARREAEKNMASVSDETRVILQEGKDFIEHIHRCNERIPDETMTEKLDVLEQVVTRIFQQVETKPESAPDLHRMMNYYLPITKKLIDAYIELDDQNLKGENVKKTRREIELSLDTINTAFETFLDSFFEDTAWDISSDITTLKTMMARDGLTGQRDFAGGERIRTVGPDLSAAQAGAAAGSSSAGAAAAMREEE